MASRFATCVILSSRNIRNTVVLELNERSRRACGGRGKKGGEYNEN